MYSIKPVIFLGETYTALRIVSTSVTLDNSAVVVVTLHTTKDEVNISHSRNVVLEGDDYAQWGRDDSYVVDMVCKKLGLERAR